MIFLKNHKTTILFFLFLFGACLLAFFNLWSASVFFCILSAIPLLVWVHQKNTHSLSVLKAIAALITYVSLIIVFYSGFYTYHGLTYNNETINDFKTSLYFSLVTWTTLGYGDFQPTNSIRLWAAFQAVFGYVFMATYIALLFDLIIRAREFERQKPIRTKVIQQIYALCGSTQCGLHNAINCEKDHQKNSDFFIKSYQKHLSELNQFTNLNSVVIGVDLLTKLSEVIPVIELLYRKMQLSFQLNNNQSPISIKSPINEIKRIENILRQLQVDYPGHFKDDRALDAYGESIIKGSWDNFKIKEKLFEPKDYITNSNEAIAFDIETAKETLGVREGMTLRTLFS